MAKQSYQEFISQHLKLDHDLESCIYELFNPNNVMLGDDFFVASALSMCTYLNADYAFIARINPREETLEMLANCHKGEIVQGSVLQCDDEPCKQVIADNIVTYKESVRAAFPDSKLLKECEAEAFCGVPLYNASRKPIGVLLTLYSHKISDAKKIETLMFMYSSKVGSELEHRDRQLELRMHNMELLVFKEELISKNRELDQINNELKKVTLKAEEGNKLKSSFLANLSHEIRTPMNAIIGFTELLKSNNLSVEEKDEYLNIIYQNGNQLMRVMDALIDISKLQAKVYVEQKQRVRVNKMVSELHRNYSQEIKAMRKDIRILMLPGAADGMDILHTHKEALCKVFDHLIDNAIKFTHHGTVYIGYTVGDGCYEFFVKDTGVGIVKGQEENIFDLFRQGDVEKSREFGGNGIGLSIVKKYVEIMDGSVWAECNQKEGALIKFIIPMK
ncbi:sensor histidine kinase [Saccharicrinis fermentans]|uniref:histidine kinase n=1 Tax=Saccharicrinis fermentans DSM 9555 = JCM 21142 TaxID=869213 RepID=W7YBA9_9BACT|nr:HAMP domain-containing sensor histidine kinase [Saccharicrinis fermentans]GAF01691.1 sensory/regulatory protein RpfC [Saccharicrinis fermentans DSM 9555 = JCM 21142]